ncbi:MULTISPECIES: helix-turn-helix domain-containing protein [Halopseudomonas]|uniref:helix-turn-helix domain-containing protein n=1 Tax=Halopseudomonas TaxID=2901189 RepID=UPI00357113EB
MSNHYTHLRIEDRATLMLMRRSDHSLRAIVSALGRSLSTLTESLDIIVRTTDPRPLGKRLDHGGWQLFSGSNNG